MSARTMQHYTMPTFADHASHASVQSDSRQGWHLVREAVRDTFLIHLSLALAPDSRRQNDVAFKVSLGIRLVDSNVYLPVWCGRGDLLHRHKCRSTCFSSRFTTSCTHNLIGVLSLRIVDHHARSTRLDEKTAVAGLLLPLPHARHDRLGALQVIRARSVDDNVRLGRGLGQLVVLLKRSLEDFDARSRRDLELVEKRCLIGRAQKAGNGGWGNGKGKELGENSTALHMSTLRLGVSEWAYDIASGAEEEYGFGCSLGHCRMST
jgi:hypothetical protein